jgi:hypothetical protein
LILLAAVLSGLVAGSLRALLTKRQMQIPSIKWMGWVVAAFGLQWLAFWAPGINRSVPDAMAAGLLVISQMILLIFALVNFRQSGFWMMGSGLGMNLLIVLFNQGLMPISPENASRLVPQISPTDWQAGERFILGKDIVLPEAITRFAFLSDRFLLPGWFPFQAAFSLGDILIALGAFWLLWSLGGPVGSKLKLNISRIIPGDWGKVGSGWLAQPLLSQIVRSGSGGRIHQSLWRRSRAVSKREKGTAR